MPHLVLEYSNNIREEVNFGSLFPKLHQILVKVASASLESCKSRAVKQKIFCVGDGDSKNAFVHLEIRLVEGRAMSVREEVGQQMLLALCEYFSNSLQELNLQITVESKEFPKNLYFKVPSGTV